jgi:hypothetical protein
MPDDIGSLDIKGLQCTLSQHGHSEAAQPLDMSSVLEMELENLHSISIEFITKVFMQLFFVLIKATTFILLFIAKDDQTLH